MNEKKDKEQLDNWIIAEKLWDEDKNKAFKIFCDIVEEYGTMTDLEQVELERVVGSHIKCMSFYNSKGVYRKSLNLFEKLMNFIRPYLEKIDYNKQINWSINPSYKYLKTTLSYWCDVESWQISDFWISMPLDYVVELTCILFNIKPEKKKTLVEVASSWIEWIKESRQLPKVYHDIEYRFKKYFPEKNTLEAIKQENKANVLFDILKLSFFSHIEDTKNEYVIYEKLFIAGIIKEIYPKITQRLFKRIKEQEVEKAETIINTQKEMLSFLTHTLRNTLSAGPQTARTITENLRDLLGDKYIENNKAAKTINKAISLLTTFNYVDNLIDTFKLFSSDKATISKKWENENEGDLPINTLIAKVIVQIISKILYYGSYHKERKILFGTNQIKQIKESFLDIVLSEFDATQQADIVFEWLQQNCPKLDLNLGAKTYNIKNDGLRFGILFSIISELLSNSISYFDGSGKIDITITENEYSCEFVCHNHYDTSIHDSKGTNKGLSFIKHIIKYVDDLSLDVNHNDKIWSSKLLIKK